MEVKVKMDRFGRILIPKKIREAKGYEFGMELNLVMEPATRELILEPLIKKEPVLDVDEAGWMSFGIPEGSVLDYDVVQMIADDREERSRIITGESLPEQRVTTEEE